MPRWPISSVTEEFHGYPGLQLMAALKEAAAAGDAGTSLSLATRITQALTTRSFRQHAGDWSLKDDGNGETPDLVPQMFGQHAARRPYFETLIVTGALIQRLADARGRMAQAATSGRCVRL